MDIGEGIGLVSNHLKEVIFETRNRHSLATKDNCIPLLPNQMTQGSKREPNNPVIEILSHKELHSLGDHIFPASIPPRNVTPGGPKTG